MQQLTRGAQMRWRKPSPLTIQLQLQPPVYLHRLRGCHPLAWTQVHQALRWHQHTLPPRLHQGLNSLLAPQRRLPCGPSIAPSLSLMLTQC